MRTKSREPAAGFYPQIQDDHGLNFILCGRPESAGWCRRGIGFQQVLLLILLLAFGQSLGAADAWKTTRGGKQFMAVDIFVDSGSRPLAAYQLRFKATQGDVKIVGIEGGDPAAFANPPAYDPKAMQRDHVIVAAFSTLPAEKLPSGRVRVATVHVQVSGTKEPKFSVELTTAGTVDGAKINATTDAKERNADAKE